MLLVVLVNPFQPEIMLVSKPEPTQVKHLFSGRLLALPAYIRQGWKSLPGTNTTVYYKRS
jgi:hypothetical protein